MLHCALFAIHDDYHCRHSFVVYWVSKQHKHHSTYPSMCHCYEPGHFAIFSPVPLQHHFHTQHCISQTVWAILKVTRVLMYWDICMYIGYQQFGFWYLMKDRQWFTFIYFSTKGPIYVTSIGLIVAQLVKALHFKSKFRELESRCGYREYWLILSDTIKILESTQYLTQKSARDVSCG